MITNNMIIGIGCDTVEFDMTSKLDWKNDSKVVNRIFSKNERNFFPESNLERYYSGRFAIKESILKCLSTGMEDGISLKDIELIKSTSGRIQANLKGYVKIIAEQKNI